LRYSPSGSSLVVSADLSTLPSRKRSSQRTQRWREMDSNHRYRIRNNPFWLPPFGPAIRLPKQKPALSCRGPMVRIHLPPAGSLRTIGSAGITGLPSGLDSSDRASYAAICTARSTAVLPARSPAPPRARRRSFALTSPLRCRCGSCTNRPAISSMCGARTVAFLETAAPENIAGKLSSVVGPGSFPRSFMIPGTDTSIRIGG
jgi:hypothetical protein